MNLKNVLNEELKFVKFKYTNFKNDKNPKVKVLDFEYPGIEGQKTYGKRKDILGWNINYFINKKEAMEAIDDIADFAKLLAANKLEMYKRIAYFYPEQAKLIRRYNKNFVVSPKSKKGLLWRRSDLSSLSTEE